MVRTRANWSMYSDATRARRRRCQITNARQGRPLRRENCSSTRSATQHDSRALLVNNTARLHFCVACAPSFQTPTVGDLFGNNKTCRPSPNNAIAPALTPLRVQRNVLWSNRALLKRASARAASARLDECMASRVTRWRANAPETTLRAKATCARDGKPKRMRSTHAAEIGRHSARCVHHPRKGARPPEVFESRLACSRSRRH